ncbi:MAG: hypothetical protein ACM3NZ_03205 [Betaproteobacteria bacterium]
MLMTIRYALCGMCVLAAGAALAQYKDAPDQAARKLNPYVYMRDAAGDKVFLESQFWRNDPAYDQKSLTRLSEVMSALEKRGFKGDPNAAQGWDKPEKVVRCRINMEVVNKRWRGKTGTMVDCENTGISEAEIAGSEEPKHVDKVLQDFDRLFKLAKEKLGK